MKYLVCYSGGHSSALVAIEAVRKHGKENVILLNHDISENVEHEDIKRFKKEVAEYLEMEITYANMEGFECSDPIDVALRLGGFQFAAGSALCTYNLKTLPFYKYLKDNFPVSDGEIREDLTILYGFDKGEEHRIQRRIGVLATKGYKSDYPLALWERTVFNTEDIGIQRPITYRVFKHANCIGCLKAGRQHWYVVYCLRRDIFDKAMAAEQVIGHSIIKGIFLSELVPIYEDIIAKGICPNDKDNSQEFWKRVRNAIPEQTSFMPCDCAVL